MPKWQLFALLEGEQGGWECRQPWSLAQFCVSEELGPPPTLIIGTQVTYWHYVTEGSQRAELEAQRCNLAVSVPTPWPHRPADPPWGSCSPQHPGPRSSQVGQAPGLGTQQRDHPRASACLGRGEERPPAHSWAWARVHLSPCPTRTPPASVLNLPVGPPCGRAAPSHILSTFYVFPKWGLLSLLDLRTYCFIKYLAIISAPLSPSTAMPFFVVLECSILSHSSMNFIYLFCLYLLDISICYLEVPFGYFLQGLLKYNLPTVKLYFQCTVLCTL